MCEGSRDQGVEIRGFLEVEVGGTCFCLQITTLFWFLNLDSAMGP